MRDVLYIGSVPADESCAQVGEPDYYVRAMRECRAFVKQLRRVFGDEPDGALLRVKACAHDFGTYHEVVCELDTSERAAVSYAYRVENNTPMRWDDEARRELGLVD